MRRLVEIGCLARGVVLRVDMYVRDRLAPLVMSKSYLRHVSEVDPDSDGRQRMRVINRRPNRDAPECAGSGVLGALDCRTRPSTTPGGDGLSGT